MNGCPVCSWLPKIIAIGNTTTIFCERCLDNDTETSVVVTFDHNVAGVNRWALAKGIWNNLPRTEEATK